METRKGVKNRQKERKKSCGHMKSYKKLVSSFWPSIHWNLSKFGFKIMLLHFLTQARLLKVLFIEVYGRKMGFHYIFLFVHLPCLPVSSPFDPLDWGLTRWSHLMVWRAYSRALKNEYLDQRLECAAPKGWSKYATLGIFRILSQI